MKIHSCKLCEGRGYALIYNTEKKIDEIQKCDECGIFESDFDAQRKAERGEEEFKVTVEETTSYTIYVKATSRTEAEEQVQQPIFIEPV